MSSDLILFHPPSPDDAGMFDGPDDEAGCRPWIHVRNRFMEKGISVSTTYRYKGPIQKASWIIFMNVPIEAADGGLRAFIHRIRNRSASKSFYSTCLSLGLRDRLAVILWEPQVILPWNYSPLAHRHFARIFTWSKRLLEEGHPYYEIVWPQPPVTTTPLDVSYSRRKLLCNFSGNKSSADRRELYSARIDVIRYMEANFLSDFDHYGPGWNAAAHPSWKGVVHDKIAICRNYRFGLCYENMRDEPGYVTEKIFDCLRAGTVPVYWGAPDIEDYVDHDAFVHRRDFKDIHDMVKFLSNMDENTWRSYRRAGLKYLQSEKFCRFLPESFFQCIEQGLFGSQEV